MSNLQRTSSYHYDFYKTNKQRQKFPKIGWWILLGLVVLMFPIMGNVENTDTQNSVISVLKQEILSGIKKSMLYSQSVILGILTEQYAVFPYVEDQLPTESRLPFSLKDYSLSPSGELWEQFLQENQPVQNIITEPEIVESPQLFTPVSNKNMEYQWDKYHLLEELVKQFYTVDPTTSVDTDLLNLAMLKNTDCSIEKNEEGFDILIYHTHSQEAFADSIVGKEADTIVGAGDILASLLEQYGYKVLHHKGQYDVEKRDYAYSNALPALQTLLKENPTIQVVIDLHRDAVGENTKLLTEIQGKQTAKVMFFNGIGRTKEQGQISYLKNPYLKENLAFSFQMKTACDEYYPGFARKIYLKAYRYNMHLCPKTLLVELGAQTNTVEEITNALYPLAHILELVLSGKV